MGMEKHGRAYWNHHFQTLLEELQLLEVGLAVIPTTEIPRMFTLNSLKNDSIAILL